MSAMHYVGKGSFFVGVPARDLTAEEAEQYADIIVGSNLYEPVGSQGAPQEPFGAPAQAVEAAQGETAPIESAGKRRKGE